MIHIRTEEEVNLIRHCGQINADVHNRIRKEMQVGISTAELDDIAREVIRAAGAKSSIHDSKEFPRQICISINDEAGHGVPGDRTVEAHDLVKIDVSVEYGGYHTDCAVSHIMGDGCSDVNRLIAGTREALWSGIACAKSERRCSDISFAIHRTAEKNRLSIIRHAFGHGIGTELHESPIIANYGPPHRGPKLRPGMVIAIEPVTSLGTHLTGQGADGWSDVTIDASFCAHFEHTVLITDEEPEVITLEAEGKPKIEQQKPLFTGFHYRDMRDADKPILLQLAAREMDPILMAAWGRRVVPDEIFIGSARTVILQDGSSKIVGFLVFSEDHDELYLNTLVIDAKFQGQGLGKQVMKWLEALAHQNHCRTMGLCVQINNHRAIRFYEKIGFEVLGFSHVNTLLMRKCLMR